MLVCKETGNAFTGHGAAPLREMDMVGIEVLREIERGKKIEEGNADPAGDLRKLSLWICHVLAVAGEIIGPKLVAERERHQEHTESALASEGGHLAQLRLDVAPRRFPPGGIEVGPVVERETLSRVKLDQVIEHRKLAA
jgi:hypothetical protein